MPVEIGQLVINARVVADHPRESREPHGAPVRGDTEQQKLIERCVAEVLRILEDRRER